MTSKKSLIALLISASVSSQAFASDPEQLNLQQILVTSSRLDSQTDLPASVTIITQNDIQASAATSLPELLGYQVGINTRSLFSNGSRNTIDMRGFGATASQNTLILLDGRRLNDIDLSSVDFSAIPLENIERIEIIHGSGAVLYGDGGSGGIINIITKDPSTSKSYSKFDASIGSYGQREGNAFISASNEHIGINANLNSSTSDGYRDNNQFDQQSGQLDIRLPINRGELFWKLGAYQQHLELPGARTVDPSSGIDQLRTDRTGTSTPNDWANEGTKYSTLGYSTQFNNSDKFTIDGGFRTKEQQSQYDYGYGYGAYQATTINALSLTPRITLNRLIDKLPVTVKFGADIYHYDYNSDRSNFKQNIDHPIHKINLTQDNSALYAQANIQATDTTLITTGWRIQRFRQNARDGYDPTAPGGSYDSQASNFDRTDTQSSYELGIKQAISSSMDVYLRHDRTVRFGTVDELYEYDASFLHVFSPLKPQVSKNYEVGADFHHEKLNSSLAVFHQAVQDEIHYDPSTYQNINLDRTKHDGVEATAGYAFSDKFVLKAAYTYLNARFTDGVNKGNFIPLIPRNTYTLTASGELVKSIKYAVTWNHVSSSYFDNDESNNFGQKIPSYQTVDIKLSRSFSNLDLALHVNNMFNEKYFTYGVRSTTTAGKYNAYPLPERTVYITASYKFD